MTNFTSDLQSTKMQIKTKTDKKNQLSRTKTIEMKKRKLTNKFLLENSFLECEKSLQLLVSRK